MKNFIKNLWKRLKKELKYSFRSFTMLIKRWHCRKEAQSVEDTILFGKYRIDRVIGRGRSGTVFLARHLALDEWRAIKRVPRECQGFAREAAVLKELKHPGIPVIYDLEEDSSYYYLIEEYLDGESLYALIERQGGLARAKAFSYGIELCRIISYLHSIEPNPILYLDLQPRNILICQGALKLIDFDQAVTARFAQTMRERYGTEGCAAPEQYTDEPLDERTDIYAIGVLLYYMGTGVFPDREEDGRCTDRARERAQEAFSRETAAVIMRCLNPQKKLRCQSAKEVLEALLDVKTGGFTQNQMPFLKVAVIGSKPGMGVTHVCLSVSSYLSGRGLSCLYRERNDSGAVRKAAAYRGLKPDRYGLIHMDGYAMKPRYGRCVQLAEVCTDALVDDFGAVLQTALEEEYDILLLVCGAGDWELEDSVNAVRALAHKENLRILFNHSSPDVKLILPGDVAGLKFYRLPACRPAEKSDSISAFWDICFKGTRGGRKIRDWPGKEGKKKKGGTGWPFGIWPQGRSEERRPGEKDIPRRRRLR